MISVKKAKEIVRIDPITGSLVIGELIQAGNVLSGEVDRLQEIITSLAIRSESTCVCEELREAAEDARIAPGEAT